MQIADFIKSLKKDTPPGEPGQVSPGPAIEPAPQEKLKTALELVQGAVGLWKGGQ